MNRLSIELALHEIGHSFAQLADEYVDGIVRSPGYCDYSKDPPFVNASTFHSNKSDIKWNYWIDDNQEIPTETDVDSAAPGLYKGGHNCPDYYRPTPNSIMRSLRRPYDAINEEKIVLSIYDYVTLLDSVIPDNADMIDLNKDLISEFSYTVVGGNTTAHDVNWFLDNVLISKELSLPIEKIQGGIHTLELIVTDPTPKVRVDSENKLSSQAMWNVIGVAESRLTGAELFIGGIQLKHGLYEAKLNWEQGQSDIIFTLVEAKKIPEGSAVNPAIFRQGVLDIPEIYYNGSLYKASFKLISTEPLQFSLLSAGKI